MNCSYKKNSRKEMRFTNKVVEKPLEVMFYQDRDKRNIVCLVYGLNPLDIAV